MSWFQKLLQPIENAVKDAVSNADVTVHVGAGGTSVSVEDARKRRLYFWALVLVVLAFFLGRSWR